MTIEVLQANQVRVIFFFMDQLSNAARAGEPEIIENHNPANLQSRPYPFQRVLTRLININIYVAKSKGTVGNLVAGFLWKQTLQNHDAIQSKLPHQVADHRYGSVRVLPIGIGGVRFPGFHDTFKGVTEENIGFKSQLLRSKTEQPTCATSPGADFQNVALELIGLR